MTRNTILLVAALAGVTATVSGCDILNPPTPEEARVLIEGTPDTRVQLITSTRFASGVDAGGVTRVVVIAADTTHPTLPFQGTYRIRGDQRFLAVTSMADVEQPNIRMQVFVDRSREFDRGGPLTEGVFYRFVYTFNQNVTSVIEIVF